MDLLILAAALAFGLQTDGDPVAMPGMYEQPYVLDTRIQRSFRSDDADWTTAGEHWRVEVQPTDAGFKTIWRDLGVPDRTPMIIDTDQRLSPVRMSNLDAVWPERGLDLVRASSTNSPVADEIARSLPEGARHALVVKDAMEIAVGQGLGLAVGLPLVQQLPGQRLGAGPAITMLSTLTLVSVDEAAGKAVVTWTTEMEPKSVAAALPDMVRAALGLSQEDADKLAGFNDLLDQAVLTSRRDCRYEIDQPTGLAEHVVCVTVKTVVMPGQKQKSEARLEATQRLVD